MATGNIFYSNVDDNLRAELIERAQAGRNRSTEYVNFMVNKIANIELIAYRNQEHAIDEPTKYLSKLGGNTTRGLDYTPHGYLNPQRDYKVTGNGQSSENSGPGSRYNSFRVGPYIKSTNVSTSDGQMGIMQTAQVDISIPDPVRDLDYVESIFMRPGRAVTLKIQYPESAVITGKKLKPSLIQPAVQSSKITENLDMNTAIYNMLVISFTMSYQTNGTVNVTLHLRGVSSVYTDVTCLINNKDSGKEQDVTLINTFYKSLYEQVESLYKQQEAVKTDPTKKLYAKYAFDVKDTESLNKSSISDTYWGWLSDTTSNTQQVYVTLGYLIRFINQNIIQAKNQIVTDRLIICNPDAVKSNIVENIVSTDPWAIMLSPYDTYGTDANGKPRFLIDSADIVKPDNNFRSGGVVGYTSLIFINLNVIEAIEKSYAAKPSDFTVTNLLKQISKVISDCTGGMIDLELISHPVQQDYLFYYDRNFLPEKQDVVPFSIPFGVKNNNTGSLVKDFKVDVKLPTSMQNLMYTINSGDSISEADIAPHINYMYNNSVIERTISADSGSITDSYTNDNAKSLETLDKEYAESYKKYNDELIKAIADYGSAPTNKDFKLKLNGATKKKMQYPTKSIQSSAQMTSPIYPHEIEFTIDGVHGFRYGDVLEFNILPNRYKKFATFSIIGVTHDVNTSGMWNTNIKCIMRPYIKEN